MMNQASNTYRYERKFIIPHKTYPLPLFLKTLSVPFREVYPPRIINNVYFDTADFRSFAENVYGKTDRLKVRMRWYDERARHEQYYPKVEFKMKRALLGTKKTYKLNAVPQRDALLNKKAIYDNVASSALPSHVLTDLKVRQPVLINRYKRRYFVSLDGDVRVTLDTEIAFRKFGMLNYQDRFFYIAPDILELKYDASHEEYGRKIGGMLPFRLTKFSKYQLGMERTFFYHAH